MPAKTITLAKRNDDDDDDDDGTQKILWITQSGYSPAKQMATVASAWLSTHPQHQMTFLAYNDEETVISSQHDKIQFVSFGAPSAIPHQHQYESARRMQDNSLDGIKFMLDLFSESYDTEVETLDALAKQIQPDLVIVDVFATSAMDYLAYHEDEMPYIVFYHCLALGILGIEDNLALPDAITGTHKHQIGFWDRSRRIVNLLKLILQTLDVTAKLNQARARNGFPTYNAPNTNIAGRPILVPTSFAFEYSRRLSPLVHFSGFITDFDKTTKSLISDHDPTLAAWLNVQLDTGTSVVYAAFGTIMVLTPRLLSNLIQGVLATNSSFLLAARPQALSNSISSTDGGDDMLDQIIGSLEDNKKKKVFHVEWIQNQQAVLQHPAVQVFVTHGGALSIAEGVQAHVPMLVIPTGSDRYANAARLVDQAHCVKLNHKTFEASDIQTSLQMLLGNETVIDSLEWMQRVNDYTGGGAPGAARWMQYILENGYQHLIPLETKMGLGAAHNLDIVAVVLVVVLLMMVITFRVFLSLCRGKASKQKLE